MWPALTAETVHHKAAMLRAAMGHDLIVIGPVNMALPSLLQMMWQAAILLVCPHIQTIWNAEQLTL